MTTDDIVKASDAVYDCITKFCTLNKIKVSPAKQRVLAADILLAVNAEGFALVHVK